MSRTHLPFIAAAAAAAFALAGCSGGGSSSADSSSSPGSSDSAASADASGFTAPGDTDKGGKDNPVTIGVVGASGPQWQTFEKLANESGIYIDLKDFTDYQQPNPATTSGDLDLNQFQHILFLAQYLNESGADLTPIGATAIYPLGVYSKQYTSTDEIPQGTQVTIPNDGTNQARALGVLQSAGLIKLKDGTGALTATPEDVDTANSKVTVAPVAADQTARSLDDQSVAAAVVNNDYVTEAGLEASSAIAQDDPTADSSHPFINVWVSKTADKDNPVYLKLVEISQSADVEKDLQANSGGTAVLVHDTPAQLQQYLTDAESELK